MNRHFAIIDGKHTTLKPIEPRIGGGGEANVYRLANCPARVVKLYHSGDKSGEREEKLNAMRSAPPQNAIRRVQTLELPMFAWPTHIVRDLKSTCTGFLMPEIPAGRAVTLGVYMSRASQQQHLSADDRSLPRRLQICRNLVAAMADLHQQQHYFVDIKPQNIFLFKDTGIVCFIDTDSYSIHGPDGRRFPASAMTDEYIAPELSRNDLKAASVQDDRQDCFAIAVLMFRLLDGGLHPFQGIVKDPDEEWTNQSNIDRNYFPHGRTPHPDIIPVPVSAAALWESTTRHMFERAMTSRDPAARPSAAEWRDHFDRLTKGKGLFIACSRRPNDLQHIHFAGKPCPACAFEMLAAQAEDEEQQDAASEPVTPSISASAFSGTTWTPPKYTFTPSPSPSPTLPPKPSAKPAPMTIFIALVVLIGVVMYFWPLGEHPAPAMPPADVVPAQPAPATGVIDLPPTGAGVVATAPAPAPLATPVTPPVATEADVARSMTSDGSADELSARTKSLIGAVSTVARQQAGEIEGLLQLGAAADDARTQDAARAGLRGVDWERHFSGWTRLRTQARARNTEALESRNDPSRAVDIEMEALALDPFDREIAGNLGYFLARNGQIDWAFGLAIYALSLPRNGSDDSGRSADWQLLGSSLARLGRPDAGFAAYAVALAITTRLGGLCASLLQQQADLGDALKAPVLQLLARVDQRGLGATENCGLPPQWR